ncbi:Dabb family protein [Gaoshiqia sp. Z1-71]|uniref:Dabb family protein n=1 Tax=Gaoshiqia hydrogeniformans TaxID=3290090 RepID=UPI003BF91C41
MKNRRHFFRQALAGAGFLGLSFLTKRTNAAELKIKLESGFVHHVFFWLKNPDNEADCKRMEEGLKLLVTIPEIKMSHVGKAVESPREVVDDSFSYSYLAVFDSKADQDRYQVHPTHLKFVEEYGDLWEKVIVYDAM